MDFSVEIDPGTGEEYVATSLRGSAILINPFLNKGTGFSERERDELGLRGLVPPAVCGLEDQLARVYESYQDKCSDLEKFIYLADLHDRNETLFFRLVHEHIEEMLPIVYTPTVGEACQKFSHIYRRARGLYVSYDQRDRIEEILRNYHTSEPSVIVVTDGERILGLGDQGAGGMGIPVGKLCLYTLCAGISPYTTLPILLDVGTDNAERLADPLYLGLRHRRVRGDAYQAFVDRFVEAVQTVFPRALLQWEDFLKGNAILQLERFRDRLCTFNDDIQGTAGVAVAGIYAGLRVTGKSLREQRVVFAGAGAATHGIADLVVAALEDEGVSREEARRRIWTVDSHGLVTTARERLEGFKAQYARDAAELAGYACADRSRISLEETVAFARPTVLVGTSTIPGIFTREVIETMAKGGERPLVFPLSNPTSRSECTPEDAIHWSDGRAVVATGSPFPPVRYGGRIHRIGQGNNAYIFPGLGLGVIAGGVRRVSDGMFLAAARALAEQVSDEELATGSLYPALPRIREVSHAVARAVIRRAADEGHAPPGSLDRLEERVSRAMWFPAYRPLRPA